MAERDEISWREFGIRSALFFGLLAGTGALAVTTTHDNTTTNPSPSEIPPNCAPTPLGHITSKSNCADYELKPHPTIKGKLCAEKGSHDSGPIVYNERTLFGLGYAVSDELKYDIEMIDPKINKVIGFFSAGVAPTFNGMYAPAENDTLACLVYPDVTLNQ